MQRKHIKPNGSNGPYADSHFYSIERKFGMSRYLSHGLGDALWQQAGQQGQRKGLAASASIWLARRSGCCAYQLPWASITMLAPGIT